MNKILADLLTRQRAALKAEATALTVAADKDNGSVLTADQETRFNAIEADVAAIDAELAAGQREAETPEAMDARLRAEIADITAACSLAGFPALIPRLVPEAEVHGEPQPDPGRIEGEV